MDIAPRPPLGRVVTFYSYKGGTGRSMALANAAWMLAANGMRVLAIDWDLEAPGLHRYFKPYLRDPALEASDGLMDFVIAFADAARTPAGAPADPAWYEPYADLRLFAYAVDGPGFEEHGGRLDFVPAGRQDAGYTLRVNSFNWQHFYSKLGGGVFLEAVKRRLRVDYDYVLIDSRTGVSDTSGVCTVQMPDTLVVCFTLNEQSIHGASVTAASAVEQRRVPGGSSALRVMPVPTRVDASEKERVDAARAAARERFDRFLDWLDDDQLDEYWGDVEMPYIPFYSLEEVLAVFDQPRVRTSLLPAVEGLVAWVSEQRITSLPPLDEKRRREELSRYLRPPRPAAGMQGRALFISHAHRDNDLHLGKFVVDLAAEVGALTGLPDDEIAFFDKSAPSAGETWEQHLVDALDRCAVMICVVSPAYLRSDFTGLQLTLASTAGKLLMPVQWIPTQDPLPAALAQAAVAALPKDGQGGFRRLVRAGGRAYGESLDELARTVAAAVRDRRPDAPALPRQRPPHESPRAVLVPIVAERSRAMRGIASKTSAYGLRRRDWVPYLRPAPQTIGNIVIELGAAAGVAVQLTPLHRFREWLRLPGDGAALVVVDALTAERPEYERQLVDWERNALRDVRVVVCAPPGRTDEYAARYAERARPRIFMVVGSAGELRDAVARGLASLARAAP